MRPFRAVGRPLVFTERVMQRVGDKWNEGNPARRRGRIIARLDALRRNRGSEEELGEFIQEELDRAPGGIDYFERWLDRQCLALLEEWTPKSRMVQ
jgi:hypothetical protein